MKILLLLVLPFSLLANWNFATADGMQASLTVDQTDVTTDSTVNLTFSITTTPQMTLDEKKLKKEFLRWLDENQIEVLDHTEQRRSNSLNLTYALRFSRPGQQAILFPNIPIDEFSVEPDLLIVSVRLPSTPQFHRPGKIADPLSLFPEGLQALSEENKEKLQTQSSTSEAEQALAKRQLPAKILALLMVACAVGYVSWRYLLPKLNPPPPPPKPIDPNQKALDALDSLQKEHLPDQKLWNQYYSKLTKIVRTYMEDRFGLRAPEQTTEEFLHDLVSSEALPSETKTHLKTFLTEADLVKFARLEPTIEECDQAFQSARQIILNSLV